MSDSIARTLPELEAALRGSLAATSMSIREIARQTEISKTLLADFRNGERNLSFQNLDALARFLGVRYNLKNY